MPSLVDLVIPPGLLSSVEQPTLEAGAVRLRPWREDDVPALVAAYDETEIQRWHARSLTPAEARAWIADAGAAWAGETGVSWAVDLKGRLAGRMTSKFRLPDAGAGVGYWTCGADRGRGVAPQALDVATRWAFECGFHRVELERSAANHASCRVAVKAGFRAEGTRRGAALHADGWHDMHLHGRISD